MYGSAYGHGRHPNSGGLCRQFLMSATSALALTVFAIAMTAEDARADDECGQPTSVTYCNGAAYNDITYQSGTNLVLNNTAMVVNGDINVGLGILGAKPATITTTSYQSLGGALNVKSSDTSASLQITDGTIDGSSMISGPLTATTTGRGNASVTIQSGTISLTGAGNAVTALAQRYGDATIAFSSGSVTSANETDAAMAAKAIGNGAHASVSMTGGSVTARQIALMAEATGVNASATANVSGGSITQSQPFDVAIISSAPLGSAFSTLENVNLSNGVKVEGGVSMDVTLRSAELNETADNKGGITFHPTASGTRSELHLISSNMLALGTFGASILYEANTSSSGGDFTMQLTSSAVDAGFVFTGEGRDASAIRLVPGGDETFAIHLIDSSVAATFGPTILLTTETPSATPDNVSLSISLDEQSSVSTEGNSPYAFVSNLDSASAHIAITNRGGWTGNAVLGGGGSDLELKDQSFMGTIFGDYDQFSGSPSDIVHQGNDNLTISGGDFNGSFYGQGGNDSVTISLTDSGNYPNSGIFDGGEANDGTHTLSDFDVFTFKNAELIEVDVSNIGNFEQLNVDGGRVSITGKNLRLDGYIDDEGTTHDQGQLNVTNGAILNLFPSNPDLNDTMHVYADVYMNNAFIGDLNQEWGALVINGDLRAPAGGVFDMRDGDPHGTIDIYGTFSVGQDFLHYIDVDFGRETYEFPSADFLFLEYDVSGLTTIHINTVGTTAHPEEVLTIAHNRGAISLSNFALSTGQYFPAGIWQYELAINSGDIYLTPVTLSGMPAFFDLSIDEGWNIDQLLSAGLAVQPYVPLYEAYQSVLLEMTRLPSLKTRSGGRYEGGAAITAGPALDAVWGRVGGGFDHFDPQSSTTGYDYDMSSFELQTGLDGLFLDSEAGALIGGITAHYQTGEAKVHSRYGDSKIHPDGYGFGGTLTWFGANGFYTDAQAALTWYSSELKADDLPLSPEDSDAFGYALSLEAGQAFGIGDGVSLTPQAQLSFASVSVDSFTGAYSDDVDFDDGQSLLGRVGLSIEKESAWTDVNGQARAANIYGLANLYYEFLGKTTATVTDVLDFSSEPDDFTGEIGFGGSIDWQAGKLQYSAFAELTASTGFSTGSYGYGGNVGLKVRW